MVTDLLKRFVYLNVYCTWHNFMAEWIIDVVLNVWILKMNMYHTFDMGFVETLCQYKYNFIPNLISTNTHELIWKQSTKFLHD